MNTASLSTIQHEKVVISGYVFAKIIHEASKSENDTEGLLCGNITQTTKDQITDSDSSGNHHELEFSLFDVIPSTRTFSFYNHVGKVFLDHSDAIEKKLLLGWYKVRRNTGTRMSMREKAIIKNLIQELNLDEGLIFILFTPQSQANRSTTSFSYKCFYCKKDEKVPLGLKVNIVNLGHTGTHPEYRNRSCLIEPLSTSGTKRGGDMTSTTAIPLLCDSFEHKFMHKDGTVHEVHHIKKMYSETMKIMKKFQENLSDTEKEIAEYEQEVEYLRNAIRVLENHSDLDETSEESFSHGNSENGHDQVENSKTRHALSRLKIENGDDDDDDDSTENEQSQQF